MSRACISSFLVRVKVRRGKAGNRSQRELQEKEEITKSHHSFVNFQIRSIKPGGITYKVL